MIIHRREHPYTPQNGCMTQQFILPDKQLLVIKHGGETGEDYTTKVNLKSISGRYGEPLHIVVRTPFDIRENKSLPEQLDVHAQNWQIKLEFDYGMIGATRFEIINIVPVKPFSISYTQSQPRVSTDELTKFLNSRD